MNKIRKIAIRHCVGCENTEIYIFRQNTSRLYGTDVPISYATQTRIESLIESGKLGKVLPLLTKKSLLIQFEIS